MHSEQLAAESVHHLRNMIEVQLEAIKPNGRQAARRRTMPCKSLRIMSCRGSPFASRCPQCQLPVSDTILFDNVDRG